MAPVPAGKSSQLSAPSGAPLYAPHAALLAPVAGYTDLPMRLSARRHGCRYAFTEMVDAGSLVFGNRKTCGRLIARDPSEDFLGLQLVGSDPEILTRAAQLVNDLDFDVLDFNLGCPAPKVAKKGEGITLALRHPDKALRAFEILVKYARIPVTAKTRILSDTDAAPTVNFALALQNAGAAAVTIHGRLAQSFYSGPVAFGIIRAVRETLSIPVIANGGALTLNTYRELLEATACANAMVARGACGNPWLFREIAQGKTDPPTLAEFIAEIRLHVDAMLSFYGEEAGFRVCRKTLLAYLRGRGFPGDLRAAASTLNSRPAFAALMRRVADGPSECYRHMLELNLAAERRMKL